MSAGDPVVCDKATEGGIKVTSGRLQVTGTTAPTSGVGTEVSYSTSSSLGGITVYDRDGSAYKGLIADALNTDIKCSGTSIFKVESDGLTINDTSAPGTTTNRLYSVSGALKWNGTILGSMYTVNAGDFVDTYGYTSACITYAISQLPSSGGIVFIPAGIWTVSSTITITGDYVWLVGEGPANTILYRTNATYGDTVVFNGGASSYLVGCGIRDLMIMYINTVTELTAGSTHIKAYYGYNFTIDNCWLKNASIGIVIYGKSVYNKIINCQIEMESGYTWGISGISLLKGSYAGGGSNYEPSVLIDNCDMYPSQPGGWIYGIYANSADGLWISNTHVGRASVAALFLSPTSNAMLAGVKCVNCWFDNDVLSTQTYSVYIEGTGSSTYPLSLIQFIGCNFQGYNTTYGIWIHTGSNVENVIIDGNVFYEYGREAIYLDGGSRIVISNNRIVGGGAAAVSNGISVASTGATRFIITGNSIGYAHMSTSSSSYYYGIYVSSGVGVNYIISSNNCSGTSVGGVSADTNATKIVANNI